MAVELALGNLVRKYIQKGVITACHDISDGGLLVAVSEMALVSNIGIVFTDLNNFLPAHAWAFGEEQGRYLVTSRDPKSLLPAVVAAGSSAEVIGQTGGETIEIYGESLPLSDLRKTHEGWLPDFMNK